MTIRVVGEGGLVLFSFFQEETLGAEFKGYVSTSRELGGGGCSCPLGEGH